jgi:P22_AR N-terminal domain/ORF6C domain
LSEDQRLIPNAQYTEDGEQLTQSGLEEAEATDQQTLVPTAVRQVNFHGDVIIVVLVEERGRRQVYVLLRPLCQYLGLSWSSQLQRLRGDDVLSEATTSVLLSNTEVGHRQRYTMIGLQLEFLPGWMFSFTPKRVRADLQEKIKRYRRDCYRVLWEAFLHGELFPVEQAEVLASVIEAVPSGDTRIVALSEQIETLSAIVGLMQEHKAALLAEGSAMEAVAANQQELMTRTVMISSQLDYVVALLEGLVGREARTEMVVARIDERTAHLTPQHAHYVREMVDRIVQEIDRHSPGRPLTYAQVYAQVYGRLKRHFRVSKYDQVSDERFEEVQNWLLEEWRRVRGGTLPEQENLF